MVLWLSDLTSDIEVLLNDEYVFQKFVQLKKVTVESILVFLHFFIQRLGIYSSSRKLQVRADLERLCKK